MAKAGSHTGAVGADELLAARSLAAAISERSAELEAAGRVPADLVAQLNAAGLFAMTIPAELGGTERDVLQILQVIEELAYADSAVAWCSMIYLTTAMSAASLPEAVARRIYGSGSTITAGATAPTGRGVMVDAGLEVSGRWAWGSGTHHADWIVGGTLVEEGGEIRRWPGSEPQVHIVFFEKSQVRLHDNWDPSGMRGTGSVDFDVDGAFVPEGYWVIQGAEPRVQTPLYRFPFFGFFAACVAAVPLGQARRALDDFAELARGKPTGAGGKTLAESSLTQMEFGRAEALVEGARRYLFDTVAQVRDAVDRGDEADLEQRRQLRMAATQATHMAASAVDILYHAGGGTSLQGYCPLQRHFRDVHVATQHRMLSSGLLQQAAAIRLAGRSGGLSQL